jgi:hypothetical protein
VNWKTLFPIRFQFLLITGQNETTATSGTMRDGWMVDGQEKKVYIFQQVLTPDVGGG